MTKFQIIAFALLPLLSLPGLSAAEKDSDRTERQPSKVKEHILGHYKLYGFVRNYMSYDNRESLAGTGDLYYYLPKDRNLNQAGEDLNQKNQFRFLAITSRLGVNVSGYKAGNTEFGGKIEADFYAGLSGVTGTATLRLRQAYMTIGWNDLLMGGDDKAAVNLKIGQAWHPLAADICPVFTLESGVPFGPFSRTPQLTMDASLGKHFVLTASALWQMQYTSTGPDGASANYIKYSCTPEIYLGVTAKAGGFLGRVGVDILSIKPRTTGSAYLEAFGTDDAGLFKSGTVKVSDRITTFSPFVYLQYVNKGFALKAKTVLSQAGEHLNLQGGYGITKKFTAQGEDGHWEYAPTNASSTWVTLAYGTKWVPMIFVGYYKNLGTYTDLYSINGDGKVLESDFYFAKNSFKNLNQMVRVCPSITYNIGKFFTIGLDYELTGAQYGEPVSGTYISGGKPKDGIFYNSRGLATDNLHWIWNHRVQAMFKFSF